MSRRLLDELWGAMPLGLPDTAFADPRRPGETLRIGRHKVLLVLVNLADHAAEADGIAFPSRTTVARETDMHHRDVEMAWTVLEQAGLIAGDRRPGSSTRWRVLPSVDLATPAGDPQHARQPQPAGDTRQPPAGEPAGEPAGDTQHEQNRTEQKESGPPPAHRLLANHREGLVDEAERHLAHHSSPQSLAAVASWLETGRRFQWPSELAAALKAVDTDAEAQRRREPRVATCTACDDRGYLLDEIDDDGCVIPCPSCAQETARAS
jgi:hypothetical protein